MRWLFTSGGQSIGSSASALPMNISFRIDWFPLGLTDLISLMDSQEPPPALQFERHLFLGAQPSLCPTLTSAHDYWKNHSFDYRTFVSKVISLLFNTLSRLVIAFLPRGKRVLMAAVTICSDFGAQKYGKDQFSFQSQRKAMPKNV